MPHAAIAALVIIIAVIGLLATHLYRAAAAQYWVSTTVQAYGGAVDSSKKGTHTHTFRNCEAVTIYR